MRPVYLLFGGVVELVLPGASEAFLDSAVFPQSLHDGRQLASKARLRRLSTISS